MKILFTLFKSLLFLVALLLLGSLFLPSSTVVSRTVEINASSDKVFSYLNDFRQFNRWSPWADIDPNTSYTFEGPETGVGSKMRWQSDHPNVGSGSQEILSSEPGTLVVTKLEFDGQGDAEATMRIDPAGPGSQVSWGFTSQWGFNPIGRYMGLMMDKWLGPYYEKGLANLKMLAEIE